MKKTAKAIIVALLMGAARASGQFEGIVQSNNYTVDDNGVGQRFDMTIWIRHDMLRVKIPSVGGTPGSVVIYRHDRRVSWVINDADRTYFEVPFTDQVVQEKQADQASDKSTVDRTKRARKLLGYQCEQIILKRGESETEIWGAKGLSDLAAQMDSLLGDSGERGTGTETEVMRQLQLFPLVSITRSNGKVVDSQEVTRIERRPLDLVLFLIPQDYKKQAAMELVEP
jgi:hypothetical protein